MKRKHIDSSVLLSNVPPPSPAFSENTMAAIYAMCAEEEKPMKRRLSATVIVVALLIVLLAATALAVGLRRSAEAATMMLAREALYQDYGLSPESIGCYNYSIEQSGDTWTVTFEGAAWEPERLGTYTVEIDAKGNVQTQWSHDDVDSALWKNGDMDSPAWGQAQILQRLSMQKAEHDSWAATDWGNLSLEEAAEMMPIASFVTDYDTLVEYKRLMPETTDIPADTMLALAKSLILDTYGVEPSYAEALGEEDLILGEPLDGGMRQYVVQFYRPLHDWEAFTLYIDATTGELLDSYWRVTNEKRTLPDGSLKAYEHAAKEFMVSGTFETIRAAEKADIAARMKEAGLDVFILPDLAYAMPGETDITEAAAIETANASLAAQYGIEQAGIKFFDIATSLLDDTQGRRWIIDYAPKAPAQNDMWIWDEINEKIGTYSVTVQSDAPNIIDTQWSLADAKETMADTDYTESNWADAPVYYGKMLGWINALRDQVDAITNQYGSYVSFYDYSTEDVAIYDTAFREAGFSANQFSSAIPAPNAIAKKEALDIAKQAILAEMPEAENALNTAYQGIEYSLRDADMPEWTFSIQFNQGDIHYDFGVRIDAMTGEVLLFNCITGGNG